MTSSGPPAERLLAAVERVAAVIARADVSAAVGTLGDEEVLALLADASAACNVLDLVVAAGSAEIARRSDRAAGYQGLAQRRGHRTVTSLVQSITGRSRGEVRRAVRTGEDLVEPPVGAGESPDAVVGAESVPSDWLGPLRDALSAGQIGATQFEAIRAGLGEPPVERYPEADPGFLPAAWAAAVTMLLTEAAMTPVEELRANARIARDRLDPVGVTRRFEERFATRSFRTWVDESGQHHARIVFDDEAAAWVHTILRAALRPRRGPRFVDADAIPRTDRTTSADCVAEADSRSNEQLQYDTIVAVLRTGAAADPRQAFGDRQPGVRILVEATAINGIDARGRARVAGVGHVEDGGQALPAGVVEKYLCDAGAMPVVHDSAGRPLDVGRERRLFTRRQRIAIAARDGGCLWPSCTAPPSQCEYHHIDHWSQAHGHTDVDDGVPLCRNCHLRLHNQGWRITRDRDPETSTDTYRLHAPPEPTTGTTGQPVRLASKSPTRFAAA
ncbi:HNH endonuclease signature motif containing protein [Microbacterium ulmi]|uniref:DUF222 domain-containing protein n=1 Tax=Microbacterium ulmi TaxID=179095 RepID=A0A7Y2M1Y6_9MICO|nr:HNH endonuclease signature motif containing protein [Microbacterium ulmi]NII70050.1 hypothetical protein [Microbacterium ulmi]NNH04852.1 DUF222 domain-containing protein [Microbacterium ulmi]